ncbi:ADP-glyceromanno-heptose 6-epimerase [uncultured Sphingomonas sp.]|uniref:ADP-glyceromanno-heptose 6-epimerase n=1 Tax=uncultured Sphingomonas sp. TaxID=158754 RepID=UPI0025D860E2|nr:ADP-glyceromanno-heptose 6-epimerase [uncultured Sphingomonas sp.]
MILVTGGAGFIGSNIVAALNDAGRTDVAVCDFLEHGDKWRNLRNSVFADFVPPALAVQWLSGRDDVDAVIHMGAISATTATDGDEVIDTNFRFSLALLDHCAAAGIPFLYASSAAVYGDGDQGFEDLIDPAAIRALRPLNLYGWSKRQFDFVVADRLQRNASLPPVCVGFRFFNVFGPNEYHKGDMKSIVAKIAAPIERGETITLFKSHRPSIADGDQRRDFIYVKDAVAAVLSFLEPGARSGIFNVGTGQARSFRELAEAVFLAYGLQPRIDYIDMPEAIREKYQYFTEASLGNLRQSGYAAPFPSLEEAVADYVGAHLRHEDPYR